MRDGDWLFWIAARLEWGREARSVEDGPACKVERGRFVFGGTPSTSPSSSGEVPSIPLIAPITEAKP